MLDSAKPDIDNICCANFAHGPYSVEAAAAGVPVIVLEKPPVIWPGYPDGRTADAGTRKRETMAYLTEVLDAVRTGGSKLLYAEDFVYFDGIKGIVELLIEARTNGKGKVLYQRGLCAHQGSHAPAYDTPSKSGGGALFNKACHPLGPALYLKQVEGILNGTGPIRPVRVSAAAMQILKHQPESSGEHFRVMQNVDGRITVVFEDDTIAEVIGHDLSISGIRNEFSVITDFAQYDLRVNPNNENELFLPDAANAGNLLVREKLPTSQGTSFPRPNQFYSHGYVNEMSDAVDCVMEADRYPQSGALMAWDTMAVLMAGSLILLNTRPRAEYSLNPSSLILTNLAASFNVPEAGRRTNETKSLCTLPACGGLHQAGWLHYGGTFLHITGQGEPAFGRFCRSSGAGVCSHGLNIEAFAGIRYCYGTRDHPLETSHLSHPADSLLITSLFACLNPLSLPAVGWFNRSDSSNRHSLAEAVPGIAP